MRQAFMRLLDGRVVPWDTMLQLEDLMELPCVTTATMEERERCAKIVEAIISDTEQAFGGNNYDPKMYVDRAVAKIRRGE